MGVLTIRLAFAGVRSRRVQSLLSVLVVAAAATALTIGLAVRSVAERPFERTFAATNGAHVTAESAAGEAVLHEIERSPGVVESTGVRPVAWTAFDRDGDRYGLRLIGLDAEPPPVSSPLLVDGDLPGTGEVALERSFAELHELGPGSTLETPGGPLRVSGTVVVSLGNAYPQSQPGIGFARVATLDAVVPDRADWTHVVGLRIGDPEAAGAFAARAATVLAGRGSTRTWLDDRGEATAPTNVVSILVSIYGVLLLVATGAVLATLVGGRVVAQAREIGTLKATGVTPRQIAGVLLVEQLGLALAGLVLGSVAGWLLTPVFANPAASLLTASETPAFDPMRLLVVGAIVVASVTVFTLVPGVHSARRTTAAALAGGTAGGARRSRLARLADRTGFPVPATVGARSAFTRRGRTILTVLALALTVTSAVATLGMESSLGVGTDPGVAAPIEGLDTPRFDPVNDDAGEDRILRPVVYSLDALLLFVGLSNLVATLLLTTRERVRDLGLLAAVGMTPRQVTGALVSEQTLVALVAGLVGLPLGLLLFRAAVGATGGADEFAYPSWWSLALLVPGLVALVAVLATPLARRAASTSVTDALRFE
ncbi:MAG TPA: ABC transporter permease [Gaiellaceae bacterium]|nr:ABC transporter permease [Gaiellaceae bacterium]